MILSVSASLWTSPVESVVLPRTLLYAAAFLIKAVALARPGLWLPFFMVLDSVLNIRTQSERQRPANATPGKVVSRACALPSQKSIPHPVLLVVLHFRVLRPRDHDPRDCDGFNGWPVQ